MFRRLGPRALCHHGVHAEIGDLPHGAEAAAVYPDAPHLDHGHNLAITDILRHLARGSIRSPNATRPRSPEKIQLTAHRFHHALLQGRREAIQRFVRCELAPKETGTLPLDLVHDQALDLSDVGRHLRRHFEADVDTRRARIKAADVERTGEGRFRTAEALAQNLSIERRRCKFGLCGTR